MGSAIARGLSGQKGGPALLGFDPAIGPDQALKLGVNLLDTASEIEERSDLVLLCVKPTELPKLLPGLSGNKRYVSIAAGITTGQIAGWLRAEEGQIARVMPNLSASIAQSVSAVYSTDRQFQSEVVALFETIGFATGIDDENLMHAVTGLSGSGPAFVFAFAQALAEGGTAEGLTYEQSLRLATQTIRGAADLLLQTGTHPSVLRNQVTSPGGTTIAGLEALEGGGFHAAVMDAVRRAAARSRELGRGGSKDSG